MRDYQAQDDPGRYDKVDEKYHAQSLVGFPGGFATISVNQKEAKADYYWSNTGEEPDFSIDLAKKNIYKQEF